MLVLLPTDHNNLHIYEGGYVEKETKYRGKFEHTDRWLFKNLLDAAGLSLLRKLFCARHTPFHGEGVVARSRLVVILWTLQFAVRSFQFLVCSLHLSLLFALGSL